ncbi:MAG: putative Ig domain-containing protein, partial [Acidobacteria bacterium]|nr:putative Ig domain-containing protein [Acidobacteriota bacterium]
MTTLATRNVADPRGTYGVALPPVAESTLLGAGEVGHGIWLSQSALAGRGYRSNLAVVFSEAGEIELRILDALGANRGSRVLSADGPAFVQLRLADLIGDVDFEGRYEIAVRTGRVLSYGVVNDNVTSDAIAVLADRAPPAGAQELLLAGAAKSPGLAGTYFSTDARVFNPAATALDLVLTSPLAPGTSVRRTVAPFGLLVLDRLLDLFLLPDGSAGPVRFGASGPLLVAARTSNLDPSGGRPGTFSAQQTVTSLPGGLVKAGDSAVFAGLDHGTAVPGTRTNLALVGGPDRGTGRLLLRDDAGVLLATTGFERDALAWGQASLAGWFPETPIPPAARVDVVVDEGSLDGYVTVIDNGTGDPVAMPLRGLCAVEPFEVAPFALASASPITSRPVALRWDFRRGASSVAVSVQRITVDGVSTELPPVDRRRDLTFAVPGIHRVELVARSGCRTSSARLEVLVCDVLRLVNPDLPEGTPGTAYSLQMMFSGGVAPHRVAVVAGALPEGLSLSAAGLLSGEPRSPGASPFTVEITDALGCTGRVDLSLAVRGATCPVLLISPTTLPVGVGGQVFTPITFTAPTGASPVAFSTSGPLPEGMALSGAGVLSGTPLQIGSFPFVVRATDANGCTGTQAVLLTVNCPSLVVTPVSVPGAVAGQAFGPVAFAVQGAVGTPTFTTSSRLPAGVTLSTDGALSGTPTEVGTFPIEVAVRDANGCPGSVRVTLIVSCGSLQVLPATLADAVAGQAYGPVTFASPNGIGTIVFAATSPLPTGLTLGATGVLSGTPSVVGSFPITVQATDGNGCIGSATRTLRVVCGTFAVLPASVPAGVANQTYPPVAFTAPAALGTVTYRTPSTLPTGLSLSASGVLSGVPTQTGMFVVVVDAVDGNSCPGSVTVNLVIACGTLTLTPQMLPSGVGGQVYPPVTLSATGGTAPLNFASTTPLPQGLALNPQGVLAGTPAFAGTFPVGVLVTDANGCTGAQTYSLVVACGSLGVLPASVPAGVAGQAYAAVSFTSSGGAGSVSFGTPSPLPAGISLSAQGVLGGTPSQTGTFPVQIVATDTAGCRGTVTVSLVVSCQTLTVQPGALPPATANAVYGPVQFSSPEALGTVAFTTLSALPAGLTLSPQGVLSGTPTQTGVFPGGVKATDANGCSGSVATMVSVSCPAIVVAPSSLPGGVAGQAYAPVAFVATGGVGAITFSATAGLPPGMTLSPQGVLSGTPIQTGAFAISVTATDANRCTGSVVATVTVACGSVTIQPASLPPGRVGDAYAATISASGGVTPYSFTATGLPPGLSLSTAGALTGTPGTAGVFMVTVVATDAAGCQGFRTYPVRICPVLSLLPATLPEGVFGAAYSVTLAGSSGDSPYVFTLASGALPQGLGLSPDGVLSGSPVSTGAFTFTVRVTDANGCTADVGRTLLIRPDARSDAFGTAVGNAFFAVGRPVGTSPGISIAGSVLGNDSGPGPLVASPAVIATANGGSVALGADGTFLYTPAPGFAGPADSFSYTLTDANGASATASVTLSISGLVWFVDSSYVGGNGASDGR